MKINKTKLIIIVLVTVICVGIPVAIFAGQKDKINEWETAQSMNQILFMETGKRTEGSLCIVMPKDENPFFYQVFFGEYIALKSTKAKSYFDEDNESYIKEYEKTTFDFYNYRTGEMEKTLDLIAMEKEYMPGKSHRSTMFDAKEIDGKRYLIWKAKSLQDQESENLEYIFYNFDEGKVVDNVTLEREYTESEKEYYKSFYILCDSDCNFLEINGYTPHHVGDYESGEICINYTKTWWDGILEVGIPASDLPRENTKLYDEFPKLKEYEAEPEEQVGFWLAGYPKAEDVLEMLMEEGTEITFEGCVLKAGASIDGKEHEISNMDDYIKWCDWKQVSRYLE